MQSRLPKRSAFWKSLKLQRRGPDRDPVRFPCGPDRTCRWPSPVRPFSARNVRRQSQKRGRRSWQKTGSFARLLWRTLWGAIGACGENVADTENISLFAVVCSSKCGQELFVTVLTVLWLEKLPGPSCRPWVSRDGRVDALNFCVHGPSDHPWTNQSCDDLLYVWGLGINESMQSEQ